MTQTYLDPCDLKTYVVTIPIQATSGVLVIVRGNSKVFTYSQFTSGEVDRWVNSIFAKPCPSSLVVQQTVTAAVTQAASAAASSAASSAASTAASSASSSASSSAASTSSSSSSSSQSSSSSGESSSSESGSGGSEGETSESKSESKSEEKKSDEKKEEKKKSEEKKKALSANPMLFASDLTTAQGPNMNYDVIASFGVSKSSLAGNETWSANAMVWSTLNQFALSGGYTKMDFKNGKLESINSYSMTAAYLDGNYMNLLGYTHIVPNPKYGTYGYNVGTITLLLQDKELVNVKTGEMRDVFNVSFSTSVVGFWTKPFPVSPKIVLSPQVFFMNSPISWNSKTGETTVNRQLGFLVGSSIDYKISKRFGFSLNYKVSGSTQKGTPLLNNFLIGSRLML